jgi:hypothetical protein
MVSRRDLLRTIAKAALLLTVAEWVILFSTMRLVSGERIGIVAWLVLVVPVGLATLWLRRRLLNHLPGPNATKLTLAFAVVGPAVLAISHVLGEVVGGYTEVVLGTRFILPVLVVFILGTMILVVPIVVISWVRFPLRGHDEAI